MTKLKVTLKRSTIGATKKQVATIRGLGLRKINSSRELLNTPSIRGMVKQVLHWVDVEEIEQA
jgi:large subunit ribosomal protein L30